MNIGIKRRDIDDIDDISHIFSSFSLELCPLGPLDLLLVGGASEPASQCMCLYKSFNVCLSPFF